MSSTAAVWSLKCTNKRKINKLIKCLDLLAQTHKSIIEKNWTDWAINSGMLSKVYPELKIYNETIAKYWNTDHYDKEYNKVCSDYKDYLKIVSEIKNRKPLLDRVIIKYNGEIKGKILVEKELLGFKFPPKIYSTVLDSEPTNIETDKLFDLLSIGENNKLLNYELKKK